MLFLVIFLLCPSISLGFFWNFKYFSSKSYWCQLMLSWKGGQKETRHNEQSSANDRIPCDRRYWRASARTSEWTLRPNAAPVLAPTSCPTPRTSTSRPVPAPASRCRTPSLALAQRNPRGSHSHALPADAHRGGVYQPRAPTWWSMAHHSSGCGRPLSAGHRRRATPDLFLKHSDKTFATYVWNRWNT